MAEIVGVRKRKHECQGAHTPDLNLPTTENNMLVPAGLVHDRITQLEVPRSRMSKNMRPPKKEKHSDNKIARSAKAAKE